MKYNEFKQLNQPPMQKKADAMGDALTTYGIQALFPSTPFSAMDDIGGLHGMISRTPTEEMESEWDEDPYKSFIPGVASSRTERRVKRQATDPNGSTRHYWAQKLAPYLHIAAGALGGGLIAGAYSNNSNGKPTAKGILNGIGIGALTGVGANAIGMGLAGLTSRRTKDEQKAYTESSVVPEWLLPGYATYNRWKSLGRAVGDSEERDAKKGRKSEEKEDQNKKAASFYKKAIKLEGVRDPKEAVIPYMTDEGKFSPHQNSQMLGPLTSLAPATLICAGLGYGIGKLTGADADNSAVIGGVLGLNAAALANLGGLVGGLTAKRRTSEEENNYLKSPTAADYLIPGVAGYNSAQTYRVNQAELEDMVAKARTKNTRPVLN